MVNKTIVCWICKVEKSVESFYKRKYLNAAGETCVAPKGSCKECDSIQGRLLDKKQRLRCLRHYSPSMTCSCCGETSIEFLSLDHIDGNGSSHRKSDKTARHTFRWVEKNGFPDGFRVLCMNCNFSLGIFGYCPHEKESEFKGIIDRGLEKRQTKRMFDDTQEQEIVRLYMSGETALEISKRFNSSVHPIYRVLREQKISIRTRKDW